MEQSFYNNLGFYTNPFKTTNAYYEENLDKYFVYPPFFQSVLGTPSSPRSNIIFAPRGGGKSAQKIMIEKESHKRDILCISHDDFNNILDSGVKNVTLNDHLQVIIRKTIIGILIAFNEKEGAQIDKSDKEILYLLSKKYLSNLSRLELKENISSIKNFSTQVKEVWTGCSNFVNQIFNELMKKKVDDWNGIDLNKISLKETNFNNNKPKEELRFLGQIAKKIGFESIYILIDKIEEYPSTNTPEKAYELISELLENLVILETGNFAFKFFLWDKIEQLCIDNKIRFDRILDYKLKWSKKRLKELLIKRIKYYSKGKHNSFEDIIDSQLKDKIKTTFEDNELVNNIDDLLAIFAMNSPRNLIRICGTILNKQLDLNSNLSTVSYISFVNGIEEISKKISRQLMDSSMINQIMKVGKVSFTIPYISNKIFKITTQGGGNKIKQWRDTGLVMKVPTKFRGKTNKPVYLYAINNLIFAKQLYKDLNIFEFFEEKVRVCSTCNEFLLREWDEKPEEPYVCHKCNSELDSNRLKLF
ncbi:hypothetical protein C8C77_12524 [Halanaerobium saccharolyticum]|uniref:Uncharacterized protein n=1 Tax=Halanaerobium saccharolyticum TaxID=43595 RepID=A0A4R7YT60_9FIRM|nr:hypothetical protein [Halanaerobium saccharolyticum]RAK06305.1 hypothetical protein C7958_12422 [Halanaerobium saccharolyticum]TDW00784.1 hypothetical protein C8C77_12524 [Halanaerobium saccharolyticum]TDX52426.1 hypothetical protein C7956_12424 [Halanaerobium saccharolyticum]